MRHCGGRKSVPELQPPGTEVDPPLPQPCYLWYFQDWTPEDTKDLDMIVHSLFDYDGKRMLQKNYKISFDCIYRKWRQQSMGYDLPEKVVIYEKKLDNFLTIFLC